MKISGKPEEILKTVERFRKLERRNLETSDNNGTLRKSEKLT